MALARKPRTAKMRDQHQSFFLCRLSIELSLLEKLFHRHYPLKICKIFWWSQIIVNLLVLIDNLNPKTIWHSFHCNRKVIKYSWCNVYWRFNLFEQLAQAIVRVQLYYTFISITALAGAFMPLFLAKIFI